MFKKFFTLGVGALIFTLGLTLVMKVTPATPNADNTKDFLSGPAAKVYLVTPASEVLWQPGSDDESNRVMIY